MPDKKKKVLILLPCLDLGGAEKQGFYIARSMQESGNYDVEVWALVKNSGNLIPNLEGAGLIYKVLDIPFSAFHGRMSRLKAYLKFFRHLVAGKFDVIIPYTYHCNVIAASTYKLAGVKKCIWFQIAMEHHVPYSFFEKVARFLRPVYAANSHAAAAFIANRHSIDKKNVGVIPNPFETIPPKNSPDYWRNKLSKSKDDLIFMMAANFFPEKDHETVIKAIAQLGDVHRHIKIVFAGGPLKSPRAHYLKSLVLDLRLQDQVIFLGPTDDISGLLSVTDFGLLSSISEGSPNSIIEYMGYYIPVIATSIPPIQELLGSDYPYLFEPKNIQDCASCMLKITGEKDSLSLIKQQNFTKVQNIYSVSNNYQEFHNLIQS